MNTSPITYRYPRLTFAVLLATVILPGRDCLASPVTNAEVEPPEGLNVASQPVVCPSNSLTSEQVLERVARFKKRVWVTAYKEEATKTSPCYQQGLEFFETWFQEQYGAGWTNKPTAAVLGDRLATNTACTDPLVLAMSGAVCIETHEAIKRFERALAGFRDAKYQAYPEFYVNLMLARAIADDSGRISALHAAAVRLFADCFKDKNFLPEDQEEVADLLIKGWASSWFKGHADELCDVVEEQGKPFAWLALTLRGENEIKLAWAARGGGYADRVSPKGWEDFAAHLKKASEHLTAAWKLKPGSPLVPNRMMTVCLGQAEPAEMRLWFDRAVAAQFDYLSAWAEMRWGLRPRWHGSREAMQAFGRTALNTKRFDTEVPLQLFEAINDLQAETDLKPGEYLYGRSDIWPDLRRMYEGYLAATNSSGGREGWHSPYAAIAYLAKDYASSRRQLELCKWKLAPRNSEGWGLEFSLVPLEVAGRTGPASNTVQRAETAYHSFDLPGAERLYKELEACPDEMTRSFARHRLAAIRGEQAIRSGEWVKFMPAKQDDDNWVFSFGKISPQPDGSLEVQSGPDGHLLYARTRMPADFEVKGQFEVVRSSDRSFQAGLVFGLPEYESPTWLSFRIKRNDSEHDVAAYASGWSRRQSYQPASLDDKTNTFNIRYQSGVLTASVNGRTLLRQVRPPVKIKLADDQFYLGLGAFNDSNQTVMRYRDIQARGLSPTSEPKTSK